MDTIKDKQRLDALAESGRAPWPRTARARLSTMMLALRFALPRDAELAAYSSSAAHSDDIEIGCGATLLALTRAHPELDVTWVVLGADGRAASEARASASAFLAAAGSAGRRRARVSRRLLPVRRRRRSRRSSRS